MTELSSSTYRIASFHSFSYFLTTPKIEAMEPLKTQCAHFLECLSDGAPPLTSGEHGLAVVKVMTGIERSLRTGGEPVYFT